VQLPEGSAGLPLLELNRQQAQANPGLRRSSETLKHTSHIIDGKSEAQRGKGPCPNYHNELIVEASLELCSSQAPTALLLAMLASETKAQMCQLSHGSGLAHFIKV
jgi:hypothetical protein